VKRVDDMSPKAGGALSPVDGPLPRGGVPRLLDVADAVRLDPNPSWCAPSDGAADCWSHRAGEASTRALACRPRRQRRAMQVALLLLQIRGTRSASPLGVVGGWWERLGSSIARSSDRARWTVSQMRLRLCQSRAHPGSFRRRASPPTGYGVYSSAVATGSLEHCLGVQFASLAPPTLRTCPLGSRVTAEPPWRG
jgi:hypothetical protein